MSEPTQSTGPENKIVLGRSSSLFEVVPVSPSEFALFDQLHNHAPLDDKVSRSMLSGSRVAVMSWDVPCIGLLVDNELVSVNVTNFSKSKRKNAWGRYLNFYLAYTVPEHRYKGYASLLVEEIEQRAIAGGWNRMKSLAGSYAGVRLHMHFGHHFYGIAKKGELIVDTPLRSGDEWPEGIPIEARNAGEAPFRMTIEDITVALRASRFNKDLSSLAITAYNKKERR
jgi:GNAT superfamily N-acetyltransferase